MGRIIGYQYDNDIKDDDAWIGTEATSRRTKQYTAQAVADYLNINGSISIVGQMSYKYSTTPLNGIGTFAVFGGGPNTVAFSAIAKLTLSNQDISEQRVVEYLDLLVGSDMIISESGQISTFGYYSIDGYVVNATNSDYYDLSVTFKSGNGAMEADKVYETQNFTLAAEENISTLQTTIDSGNTYQASTPGILWTWDSSSLIVDGSNVSGGFYGIFSGKYLRLRSTDFPNYTTLGNGSLVIPLPGAVNTRFRLSANPLIEAGEEIGVLSPATSGTLALTTDITDSPWDTVLDGINYAGGNVGIGTTSLSAKLEVNGGEIRTTRENAPANHLSLSTTSAGSFIKNAGGTSKGLTFDNVSATSPYINFKLLSSEAMRITSAGNVGVGTTSPSAPLDVATISSGPVAKFVNTSGTGGAGVVIQAGVATSSSILTLFDYQNNERLRVRGDGNVGIGTTAPGYNLHIADTDATINLAKTDGDQYLRLVGGSGTNSDVIAQRTLTLQALSGNVLLQPTGNVGIGTTTPNAKLHVYNTGNGEIEVERASGALVNIQAQSAKGLIGTDSNHTFSLKTNSSERLTILNSGNVGIGTTSPSVKLHVDSASVETIAYFRSTDNRGRISIADNDTTNYVISEGSKMSLGSNASLSAGNLTIDSSGKVGIGTTNPTVPLLVQYTDTHTSGDLALANSALDIYNDSSNDVAGKGSTITFSDTYSGANKTTRAAIKGGTDTAGNTADGFLAFYTDSGGANSMQEVARFNRQGRMGINTDSPRQLLDVDGNMFVQQITAGVWGSDRIVISQRANNDVAVESFASQLFLSSGFNGIAFEGSANTTLMYLNDSGNLGIGTTSPSAPLNIVNSNPKIVLEDSDNANTFGQIRQQAGNLQFLSNNNTSNGTIQFKLNNGTATTDVLNIISNGNVGIGTTSPTSKLDVAGGDIELDDVAAGIIMRSPDGTKYKITVANGGTLTVTAI